MILLIEPYGIEMILVRVYIYLLHLLLIEPYGIEIREVIHTWQLQQILLIEPYGIEIRARPSGHRRSLAFNRTLWN